MCISSFGLYVSAYVSVFRDSTQNLTIMSIFNDDYILYLYNWSKKQVYIRIKKKKKKLHDVMITKE